MSVAPQSIPAFRALPVLLVALCAVLASPVGAQSSQRLERAASLRKEPGGTELAQVDAGTSLVTGTRRGEWIAVTLEGWIWSPSVARTSREGFDLVVSANGGENLRASPNGGRIARVAEGMLLDRRAADGRWVRVRREGWVLRSAFAAAQADRRAGGQADSAGGAAEQATAPVSAEARAAAGRESVVAGTGLTLSREPGGEAVGTLEAGMTGEVVARSGEWAKVRVEAWVPAADLRPSAGGPLRGVSAAELRADPDRYLGKALEWRLQLISIQKADALRPELPAGREYLLTRGPLPESGFVYVIVPEALMPRFHAMAPLDEFLARGVLRAARSRFLPTPVLELVEVGG